MPPTRSRPPIVLSALVCLCFASSFAALQPISEIDVIRNGGFEEGAGADRPALWTPRRDVPDGVRLSWDDSQAHTGKRCLAIRSRYEGDRPWFWWDHPFALGGGVTYRLSAWVWSEQLSRGAVLVVNCSDRSGKRIFRRHVGSVPKDSQGWRKITGTFDAPTGTVKGSIQFSMHGSGAVRLDDLRVARLIRPEHLSFAQAKVYPVTSGGSVPVDGRPDEWAGLPRAVVPHAYRVTQAEAIVMDQEESKGSADLSFDFAVRHDAAHLYVLVSVRDDVRRTVKPYWNGDSIQLALDTQFGRSARGYGPGDYAIGIRLRSRQAEAVVERQPEGAKLAATDMQVGTSSRQGGYTAEIAIPWAKLGVDAVAHGRRMGFCIIVNDNDGRGRKWAEWTPGIAKGKTPAQYGTLLFITRKAPAVSLSLVTAEPSDLRPVAFRADVVSLAPSPVDTTLTFVVDDGREGMTDARRLTILAGLTSVPLAYAAGSVPAGDHTAAATLAGSVSRVRFNVLPMRAVLDETRERLDRIRDKARALAGLIKEGRADALDVALQDATLVTAEHFLRWIPADAARDGHERLALREATRLEPLLDRAIVEAKDVLAAPGAHPAAAPPNVMQAVLRGANWFVGERPVFLIGFNGFDKRCLADLPRLGCNFDTSGGGAAAYILNRGPEPEAEAIQRLSVDPVRAAAKLGIRSNIHFGHRLPRWAEEKHLDITAAEGHFMFYDMDHPEARRLTCTTMEAIARALRGLPGVACYDLWNEAAYHRMSKRGLAKFRAAMRGQYGDIARLNASWGTAFTHFDRLRPFTRDPDRPAAYMDWVRWNNSRFSDYVAEMRAAVRRGDPNALTTVKFSNEAVIVGSLNHAYRRQQTSRHNLGVDRWAMAQLLEIQGCDTRPTLLSPDYAFAWRYPGMAYDLQRSMAPDKPIDDSEWHAVQTVYFENEDQPAEFVNASLWFSYLHGMDMNLTWWWSRTGTAPKAQWFTGSLLTQPQLLEAWARNSITVQRHAPEIAAFQDVPPRVRLLFSKPSAILDLSYLDMQRDAYETLHWFGVPVGFVTEEMLLAGFRDLDVLVIPAARHASAGVRGAVAKLATSGVPVWTAGDHCLSLTPHGRPIENPVPLPVESWPSARDLPSAERLLRAAGIAPAVRCIGADGLSSKPVELRTVECQGRLLGYWIGLGKEPCRVTFLRGERPARWTSILTGRRGQGRLTVQPYDFDLVAFE